MKNPDYKWISVGPNHNYQMGDYMVIREPIDNWFLVLWHKLKEVVAGRYWEEKPLPKVNHWYKVIGTYKAVVVVERVR